MNKPKCLLILFFTFTFSICKSKNEIYENYTTKNGLPSNETIKIVSAKNGYLWISTDKGICRFDGRNFENFTKENGIDNDLVDNIFVSPNGIVWVINNTNLFYFNGKNFEAFKYNNVITKNFKDGFTLIGLQFRNEQPYIFSTTDNGRFTININGVLTIKPFTEPAKLSYIDYNSEDNIIWGEYTRGSLLPKNKNYNSYFRQKNIGIQGVASNYFAIKQKNDNRLIIINKTLLTLQHDKIVSSKNLDFNIEYAMEDKQGDIWLCSSLHGVYKFIDNNINSTPIVYFSDNRITSVCQDFEGGFWFTSHDKGLFYLPDFSISTIQTPANKNNDIINCISSGGQNELIIGANAIDIHLLTNNKWQKNIIDLNSMDKSHYYTYFIDKTVNLIAKSIYYDSITNRIATSHGYCSFIMDRNKNKTQFIGKGSTSSIIFGDTIAIATNRNSIIKQHLNNLDTTYLNRLKPIHCINPNILFQSKKNTLWVGLDNGIGYVQHDSIVKIFDKTIHSKVTSIVELKNGTIVIGTIGKGLYFIENNNLVNNISLTEKKENSINKLLYNNDTLWCATQCGIVYFNTNNLNAIKRNYISTKTSFMYEAINDISYYKGNIYALAENNIYKINTNKILISTSNPTIELKNIIINDTLQIGIDSTFSINKNFNKIRIEYNAIAFRVNNKITYQFCLTKNEGEIKWQTTTQPFVEFTNLETGNYVFHVKCINNNDLQSKEEQYVFSIPPYFWQNWWFWLLLLSIFALAFYLYNKQRIAKIHKQNNMRELLLSYEQQALASQINPHFIFNVINNIQGYILKEDKRKAHTYLSQFAKLMRLSLDNSREKWVLLKTEMELINLYMKLEMMRFETFEFEVNIAKDIEDEKIIVPSMLIQPYLENAVKHGIFHLTERRGKILLHIYRDNENIVCEIDDNGIGRTKAETFKTNYEMHKSAGQLITKQRLELLLEENNQTQLFKIIDKPNQSGTKILLYLPYKII